MKKHNDPRHQARRLALSHTYSNEVNKNTKDSNKFSLHNIYEELNIINYDKKLYKLIITGVYANKKEIIKKINTTNESWMTNNMFIVDKSILLIAIWELIYTKTPIKVIIDEAVELSKEFSSSNSAKFINGILSNIHRS